MKLINTMKIVFDFWFYSTHVKN